MTSPGGIGCSARCVCPASRTTRPSLGPAGRGHASLADWAKFAAFHMGGKAPSGLSLEPATLEHLHTPPTGGDYACGWVVRPLPWDAKTKAIWHNGSNTMWYAEMWVVPSEGYAILVATNQFGDAGVKACDEAAEALAQCRRTRPQRWSASGLRVPVEGGDPLREKVECPLFPSQL